MMLIQFLFHFNHTTHELPSSGQIIWLERGIHSAASASVLPQAAE